MKVLIVTSIFPPDIGGPAGYVERLVREFDKRHIPTAVIYYSAQTHPLPLRYFLFFYKVLRWGRHFDVIYCQDLFATGLPTALACWLLKKKFLVKFVGDFSWEYASDNNLTKLPIEDFQRQTDHPLLIKLIRWGQFFTARQSYKIIVPSYYLKGFLEHWGVVGSKIEVVYNAVTFTDKTRVASKEVVIFSAGRLTPWKGFASLIKIFGKVVKDFPRARLVIAGDGPWHHRLENIVIENAIPRVSFKGRLNQEEMMSWYGRASCFVLFSGYEGLSHVLLEALSFRLPVIASDRGGNGELIKDGINGWLVPWPNEEFLYKRLVTYLNESNQGIVSLSKPGLLNPEDFSWEKNLDKTVKTLFYESFNVIA